MNWNIRENLIQHFPLWISCIWRRLQGRRRFSGVPFYCHRRSVSVAIWNCHRHRTSEYSAVVISSSTEIPESSRRRRFAKIKTNYLIELSMMGNNLLFSGY